MTFKEILLDTAKKSNSIMDLLKAKNYKDLKEFTTLLKEYIQIKLLLEDEDVKNSSIIDLCKKSNEKINLLSNTTGFDISDAPGCNGKSSIVEKKLLLLLTIRRNLKIEKSLTELTLAYTIEDLASIIYNA